MSAAVAPLPPDEAGPEVSGRADPRSWTQRRAEPAPDHRLGVESAAAGRMVAVLDRVVPQSGRARVPLAMLGRALASSTGGDYRDDDPVDRELVVRIVAAFWHRLAQRGWDTYAVPESPEPGASVIVSRCERSNRGQRARLWSVAGTRWELARWARRAAEPEPEPEPLALVLRPVASVDALEWLAELKARHPQWPPPVLGPRRGERPQPLEPGGVWREPAGLLGCSGAGEAEVPCVVLAAPRVRCSACGTVTEVAEDRAGPQLLACTCAGPDGAVCAHPPGTMAPVRRSSTGVAQ